MPISRINENFIDKTFSIVANILLRIIPTTLGEKRAFTYYRDDVIWFHFFLPISVKKNEMEKPHACCQELQYYVMQYYVILCDVYFN